MTLPLLLLLWGLLFVVVGLLGLGLCADAARGDRIQVIPPEDETEGVRDELPA